MKTFFVIVTTCICALFLTLETFSQPANTFYDQVDGTFKQEGGDQTLKIKRHIKEDDIGNMSQGILVNVSGNPTPLYCILESGNQPNRYVVEVNKTMAFEYTSQNSLVFKMPGASVSYKRVYPHVHPASKNPWAATEVLIKNRYRKNSFLKFEGDNLYSGSLDGASENGRWIIEFVPNSYYFRIKKENTNKYLNLEGEFLECSNVSAGHWTSHWKRVHIGGKYFRIENRYRKGQSLNLENGSLDASVQPKGHWTAQWEFQPAYLPSVIDVDNNSDDVIESFSGQPFLSAKKVRFSLSTASGVKDWKGLKVFDKNGKELCILETNGDNHGPVKSKDFDITQFGEKITIEFWKAKIAGVHTHVGTTQVDSNSCKGQEVSYKWKDE